MTYAQLLAVVFVTGSLTVFFDVAYQSILPALVERDQLADGNAKLEISRSGRSSPVRALAGCSCNGSGRRARSPPTRSSFVASAIFIRGIRAKEPPIDAHRRGQRPLARARSRDPRRAARTCSRHRVLRMIAGSTATSNFFSSMTMAVFLLYAVRELGYSAGIVGLVFSIGNVGVLVAAVSGTGVTQGDPARPRDLARHGVAQVGMLILAAAPTHLRRSPYFVAAWLLFGFGGTLYNIDQVSLRQAITRRGCRAG